MKRIAAALLLLFCLTGLSAGPGVEKLAWLSGRWVEERGQSWTEENWSQPRGGVMLGTSLTGKGHRVGMYEFMRIAAGDGPAGIVFWASPNGKAPVPFRLVEAGERWSTFENLKNDFPTRITYRRTGKVLTATISGPGGAGAMSWTYRRR